jgi:small redox-active disulfide protein 2
VRRLLEIKILGAGCSNCERLYEATKKAVDALGAEAQVTKVTDYAEMMKYGILQTPALVIDGRVVMTGKVPGVAELTTLLATALSET